MKFKWEHLESSDGATTQRACVDGGHLYRTFTTWNDNPIMSMVFVPTKITSYSPSLKKDNIEPANKKISQNDKNTRYIPVPNWEKHHEWPPIGGLRNLIFNRHTNGFDKFGVIKKVGKRVLIDEAAFFLWASNHKDDIK